MIAINYLHSILIKGRWSLTKQLLWRKVEINNFVKCSTSVSNKTARRESIFQATSLPKLSSCKNNIVKLNNMYILNDLT